jgi:hypothetical protein
LTKRPGPAALDCFDEAVDAVLRVTCDEQVYVVGHRFELDDRRVLLSADLPDDMFESPFDLALNGAPVIRASRDVVSAAGNTVPVRTGLKHARNMQRQRVL